ncbi:MAG: hypothetical protein PHY43_10040 [Verrucomicrobiales bacterium]|nr:hypothetical protein [Verrucomicrobiales bacterium]
MQESIVGYLLTGSLLSLLWPWIRNESREPQSSYLKTSCSPAMDTLLFLHMPSGKNPLPAL